MIKVLQKCLSLVFSPYPMDLKYMGKGLDFELIIFNAPDQEAAFRIMQDLYKTSSRMMSVYLLVWDLTWAMNEFTNETVMWVRFTPFSHGDGVLATLSTWPSA